MSRTSHKRQPLAAPGTWRILLPILAGLAMADPAQTRAAEPASALEAPPLGDLTEGLRRAMLQRRPILVSIGTEACPWCRRLEAEIRKPEVQKELARWTLVVVNLDRAPEAAEQFEVGPVPALRLLTPSGQPVAARDGFVKADELIGWLRKHFETAQAPPDDALLATGAPDAAAVGRLVERLGDRSPAIREAAARRLFAYPDVSRAAVVRAFHGGNLATRLAALEVLGQWRAPVETLDPWRGETLTAAAMAALDRWAARALPKSAPGSGKLSEEQLAEARRQLDRMLKVSPAEADAIREHLARFRSGLLGEVYARLGQATSDQDRQRLLAMRYRLVASDALVLRWPGGLVRLASADSRQRQAAAEELAAQAAADDQPLLLELFSDPDPLVREISLRGLQQAGGKEALASLVKLLEDPQPNVRAAVLKQLAENPSRGLVPQVAGYVAKETDADLVVHAIRFLAAAGGPQAVKCLMQLLAHPQWQVRADAAEALGKAMQDGGFRVFGMRLFGTGVSTELKADAYVALIGLLDDPDGFVVSRAVEALAGVDTEVAVEPLVRAAGRRPDLMPKIVELLAGSDRLREGALPHLRSFAKHKDPAARAAAIKGLAEAVPDEIEQELAAGLNDAERRVRVAAAEAVFHFCDRQRMDPEEYAARKLAERLLGDPTAVRPAIVAGPARLSQDSPRPLAGEPPTKSPRPPAGEGPGVRADDSPDRWLLEFYAGRGQPKWMPGLKAPLEKVLSADAPDERFAGAMALVPLGQGDRAIPVILACIRSEPRLVERAGEVLPWLVWEKRLEAFGQLRGSAKNEADLARLLIGLAASPDRRAVETFWQLLDEPKMNEETATILLEGLREAYLGKSNDPSEGLPASTRNEVAKAVKPRLAQGGELARLAALILLAEAAPEEAAQAAAGIAGDTKASEALRNDAFQVLLLTQPKEAANRAAVDAISGGNLERRKKALAYLVEGPQHLVRLRNHLYIQPRDVEAFAGAMPLAEAGVPKPPRGVTLQQLRPLLSGSDAEAAAYAGYLAALLGHAEGLPPLLRYWQNEGAKSPGLPRLVYTAIAALDDSTQIPVLRKILEDLSQYEVRDFYWTIRSMTGPEALGLRKEIRDRVGMENLR